MTGKLALAAIVLAAVSLVLLICTRPHHSHAGRTDRSTRPPSAPRASRFASSSIARSPSPSTVTMADAQRLLPFALSQIADAGQLSLTFTAAYASYRYDEPPREYLARLTPMMSTQLRPSIDRAAADPTLLDQRHRQHEVATATAHAETIRTLGPSSITLIVTATTHITGDYTTRTETARYAVTTIRRSDGWLIYAIELATTGDTGDTGERDGNRDGP